MRQYSHQATSVPDLIGHCAVDRTGRAECAAHCTAVPQCRRPPYGFINTATKFGHAATTTLRYHCRQYAAWADAGRRARCTMLRVAERPGGARIVPIGLLAGLWGL